MVFNDIVILKAKNRLVCKVKHSFKCYDFI
jgi:hypothetical protein